MIVGRRSARAFEPHDPASPSQHARVLGDVLRAFTIQGIPHEFPKHGAAFRARPFSRDDVHDFPRGHATMPLREIVEGSPGFGRRETVEIEGGHRHLAQKSGDTRERRVRVGGFRLLPSTAPTHTLDRG